MIHLDTSFLIRAAVSGSTEGRSLERWFRAGQHVRISAMAWAEFLCGPVPGWVAEETAELFGEPVPFDGIDGTVAAQLFNTTGRRRGTMVDCMIASVAIRADAALATANVTDFRRFTPLGLTLASR